MVYRMLNESSITILTPSNFYTVVIKQLGCTIDGNFRYEARIIPKGVNGAATVYVYRFKYYSTNPYDWILRYHESRMKNGH